VAALRLLDQVYDGDAAVRVDCADWEGYLLVESTNGCDNSALYGEIPPASFAELLRRLAVRPDIRFYDLGSGTGKLVALAALMGFEATGIELEPGRHQRALAARAALVRRGALKRGGSPQLVQGSILEHDFSDADLVFADSVAFSPEMMETLARSAAKMKPGTRVVSYKTFPGAPFATLGTLELLVTWKQSGTSVFQVQEVRPSALEAGLAEPAAECTGAAANQKSGPAC